MEYVNIRIPKYVAEKIKAEAKKIIGQYPSKLLIWSINLPQ